MTLSVSAVDYRIGDFTILDRVTAEASQGEVVGLVGPNGAGKSTLANVITGIVHPTGGQVTLDGKILTNLLPWQIADHGVFRMFQDQHLAWNLTAMENLIVMTDVGNGMSRMRDIMRAAMPSRGKPSSTEAARVMIERLGLAEQSEVRACDLSFGQQRLLALGKALIRNGQVLILDEPFSGLQQDAAFAVLELIHQAKPGRIVLVIDHTISGMRAVADRVWYMHRGRLTAFASYPEMEDSEVFKESYLGVRSKMEPRPNAPISIVHNDVPSERRKVALNGALYVGSTRGQMAKDMPLMSVKNLTGGYGGRDIVAAINLDLFPGDILCLIGRNGSGKSTLLRALMGALPRITGDIWLDSIPLTALSADKRVHLGLRLLPQEGRVLAGFSVRENLTLSAAGASASPYSLSLLANSEVRKIAENAETMFFNGRTPRPEQDAGKLSGGEQARLAFIQLEFGSSKVFLLDEPTAGIDGMARDRVEQFVYLAVGRGAAVMMIEHDLDFVTRIASRVAILSDSTMQELSFTPGEHSDQLVYRLSTGVGPSRQ